MRFGSGQASWRHLKPALHGMAAVAHVVMTTSMAMAADDDDNASSGWSERITDSVKDTFGGFSKKLGLNKPPGPAPSEAPSGCPTIVLLPGTEAQRVMAAGATGNQGLRYQYSIMSVGRECSFSGTSVTIKVGADGRVLLGPVGSAGHFDVPIRVAVYSEAQQKAVQSRLFRVPVSMPAGQSAVDFNFVSDALTLAIPRGRGNEYSIKVGIDAGKEGSEAQPSRKHHRRKAGSETADNTNSRRAQTRW